MIHRTLVKNKMSHEIANPKSYVGSLRRVTLFGLYFFTEENKKITGWNYTTIGEIVIVIEFHPKNWIPSWSNSSRFKIFTKNGVMSVLANELMKITEDIF